MLLNATDLTQKAKTIEATQKKKLTKQQLHQLQEKKRIAYQSQKEMEERENRNLSHSPLPTTTLTASTNSSMDHHLHAVQTAPSVETLIDTSMNSKLPLKKKILQSYSKETDHSTFQQHEDRMAKHQETMREGQRIVSMLTGQQPHPQNGEDNQVCQPSMPSLLPGSSGSSGGALNENNCNSTGQHPTLPVNSTIHQATLDKLAERSRALLDVSNPFEDSKGKVEYLSITPPEQHVVSGSIRIDPFHVVAVGHIPYYVKDLDHPLAGKGFNGWAVIKCKERESKDEDPWKEYVKVNAKTRPWGINGKLSLLPEFHLALRRLQQKCSPGQIPSCDDLMLLFADEREYINLDAFTNPIYPANKYFSFGGGDYLIHAGLATYKTTGGQLGQYHAVTLSKKKSPNAKKNTKMPNKDFFSVQTALKNLDQTILAIEALMRLNQMPVLPLPPLTEEEREEEENGKEDRIQLIRTNSDKVRIY